jgi:HK97 family phage prohead protease
MTVKFKVKQEEEFQADSFRTINISKKKGIKAVIGVLKGGNLTATKSFIFEDEDATDDQAKQWVEKNGHKLRKFNLDDYLDCRVLSSLEEGEYDTETTQVFKEYNQFEVKKLEEGEDGVEGVKIAGYLSTFKNMDRYGDIVVKEAFDETIKDIKKNRGGILPMLKDHWNKVDMQAGSWKVFKVDDIGLYVEGVIVKSPLTEHLLKLVEGRHINTLSMGGMFVFEDKKGKRFIIKVNLLEGSIVTIPANPKAQFGKKSLFDHDLKPEVLADEAKTWEVERSEKLAEINNLIGGL